MINFFKKEKSYANAKKVVEAIYAQKGYIHSVNDLKEVEAYEQLKTLPEKEQKALILQLSFLIKEVAIEQGKRKAKNEFWIDEDLIRYGKPIALEVQQGLLRKKLNYSEKEWMALFDSFRDCMDELEAYLEYYHFGIHQFPINFAIKQIEYYLKKNELSAPLSTYIQQVLEWPELKGKTRKDHYYGSDLLVSSKKLKGLLKQEEIIEPFRLRTEDIGPAINEIVDQIKVHRTLFDQLLGLAIQASGSKPTKKFMTQISQWQDEIGLDVYRKVVHQLLQAVLKHQPYSKTTQHSYREREYEYTETYFLCTASQNFIKGLVWTFERFSDKETIRLLSLLCEKAYTKIPGKGPAAASMGNACVYVLGNMRGKDGLGALSRLKLKVRQNNVKKTIDKYLVEGAKKYNVSVEELKEMAVPDFRLSEGSKTIVFDDYRLQVAIEGKKVKQQWIKPDGSFIKSVPSLVKQSTVLTNKLKEVRKEVKEIQKVFAAQKQRVDNQFILDRGWDFASFQKYYFQHGLMFPLTTRLIWTFSKGERSVEAIWREGQWRNLDDQIVDWLDEETSVKLWHPVQASEATILAWREKMIYIEWKQPLKQAFREIYILTDAEINTRTYSNRMAAHILKQHQFNSLASLRGWKYSLLGAYDDGRANEVCQKHLPEHQMTAEYWIDELYQEDSFNDAGIWLYVATDQVKFKDAGGEPLELEQVPKMVFTEIMRDVDLFVGVSSVGNDPQWIDNNGERQAHRDYWTAYSFGDLTEIAKTRKTILERLLPRLKKIRDKAHIDGKFLIVKGSLRTYKIHIGSGNILMEPNDQYLCIVPARSAETTTDRVFIPFEGDKGLSIVLSKAFLLAEDEKITDSTITSQINR